MIADSCVDIVIPTWNGLELLTSCLRSIDVQSFTNYTIIVVDNGSTDGTVAVLRESYPEVRLVAFPENRGFSVAVNAGIQAGSSPLVFLLNNDTELEPDCLHFLIEAAQRQNNQFFAAKMLDFKDHNLLDGAGDSYLRGGVGYRLGTMERDGGWYNERREVFGACAGAALYRRSFFDKVGLFDEDFFAYLEDVDLNLRANRQGLRCCFVPEARVYHVGSASTGSKINPVTVRLSTRNTFFVLLKNYSFVVFLRCLPAVFVYHCCWFFFCLKKGQVKAYFQGVLAVPGMMLRMRKKYWQGCRDTLSTSMVIACLKTAEGEVLDAIARRRSAAEKGNLLLSCYRFFFL